MILVSRICVFCGRKFKIEHTPGTDMPNHCPDLSCALGASLMRKPVRNLSGDETHDPAHCDYCRPL